MKPGTPIVYNGLLQATPPMMSLRDLFAAHAMQAIIVAAETWGNTTDVAADAYAHADAMCEEGAQSADAHARESRLVSLGQEVVDWALESGACYLCTRLPNGAHAATCPVGEYIAAEQKRDTDPMPADPEISIEIPISVSGSRYSETCPAPGPDRDVSGDADELPPLKEGEWR